MELLAFKVQLKLAAQVVQEMPQAVQVAVVVVVALVRLLLVVLVDQAAQTLALELLEQRAVTQAAQVAH